MYTVRNVISLQKLDKGSNIILDHQNVKITIANFFTFDSTFLFSWVKAYLRDEHFLKTPTVHEISSSCFARAKKRRKKNSPTYQSAIIESSGHFGLQKL